MSIALFMGRFSPFHDGHAAIVDHLLSEGKTVCIAIRDTERSEKNPFSFVTRHDLIRGRYPNHELVRIIRIPDIAEVVYGRNVGYRIREVRLDPEVEAISATALRREMA